MASHNVKIEKESLLRNQAELLVGTDISLNESDIKFLSYEEILKLIHELQVHQIELIIQNEELLRTQGELEIAKTKYFNWYNMSPLGFVTLNDKGMILEANIAFNKLIGYLKKDVPKSMFTRYIFFDDQDIYYKHQKQVQKMSETASCELRMVKQDGTLFHAKLDSTRIFDSNKDTYVSHCVVSDLTECKDMKENK